MDTITQFLKSATGVWISNSLLLYAILQIFVNKFLIKKHDKKMKYAVSIVKGGHTSEENKDKEKEAYRYKKSIKYRIIEFLRKLF
jgi:hypothetical protein